MTNSSSSTPAILNDRPQTQIRLFLRASNLPKSMTARGYRQPDTLARVAILTPDHRRNEYSEGAADNTEAAFPPLDATFSSDNSSRENLTFDEASHSCCEPSQLKTRHDQVMDQTEIVCKCSNPRWTASFCAKYEYGSQLIFFVEVFAIKRIKGDTPNGKNGVEIEKSNTRSLGKAAFDVQDVLGSKNHVKARRLPKGGVIYAQIEQLHGSNSFFLVNTTTSSAFPKTSSNPWPDTVFWFKEPSSYFATSRIVPYSYSFHPKPDSSHNHCKTRHIL
mmetsp:Transcript_24635/g.51582  ORF Transcript_24635/g.51582 Transcript_24635/m.51582 type:complete len:276 (+) Transcript_24635:164-991(+)